MKPSTEHLLQKYNTWASKLSNASTRGDKKAAKEMCNMYRVMLFQRNIHV